MFFQAGLWDYFSYRLQRVPDYIYTLIELSKYIRFSQQRIKISGPREDAIRYKVTTPFLAFLLSDYFPNRPSDKRHLKLSTQPMRAAGSTYRMLDMVSNLVANLGADLSVLVRGADGTELPAFVVFLLIAFTLDLDELEQHYFIYCLQHILSREPSMDHLFIVSSRSREAPWAVVCQILGAWKNDRHNNSISNEPAESHDASFCVDVLLCLFVHLADVARNCLGK